MIEEVEKLTKEQLEQYTSIKEEIKELEAELDKRKSPVSDIVTGSMEDYPYTQHSITIQGLSSDTYSLDLKLTYKKNSTGTAEGRNQKIFLILCRIARSGALLG